MSETVLSRNNVPIRLTDERWVHIIEEHCELAGMRLEVLDVVANPLRILAGGAEELLALRETSSGRYLVVVYREFEKDGFIITAFLTSKIQSLNRRKQLWPTE
jgi:hypothetical protein